MSRYFPLCFRTCIRGSTCSPTSLACPPSCTGWSVSFPGLHILCWVEAGSVLQPDSLLKYRLQTTSRE